MITRSGDVDALPVHHIEGEPVRDGTLLVKALLVGSGMTMLETFFPQGVRAPAHTHEHESLLYVVTGRLRMFVGPAEYILGPGDASQHAQGVSHRIEAIEDSLVLEVKSPPPDLGRLFGTNA